VLLTGPSEDGEGGGRMILK